MTISFVNSAASLQYFGNDISLTLPSGVTAGNLLLGFVASGSTSGTHTWPAGWTKLDGQQQASYGYTSFAYRIADGSETAPTVTIPASTAANGVICQFSGASGIGAAWQKNAGAVAGESVSSITSTAANSVACYLWWGQGGAASERLPTPSGWSREVAADSSTAGGNFHIDVGTKALGGSGSSSGSISETSGRSYWHLWNFELQESAPPATGTSSVTLDSLTGSATAASGNVSVAALGDIAGSASAITGAGGSSIASLSSVSGSASAIGVAAVSVDSGVSVATGLIGEPVRLAFADSAVLASSGASSPIILVVLADSSVLTVHAASAYRLLDVAVDSNSALSTSAPVAAVYSVSAASLVSVLTGLQFVADFTDGWAYNLNTGAGSFYEGFRFNSFALIDGEYYGANEAGIFRLGDDADDSAPIDMTITLGTSNLGSSRVKRVPTAYVGAQSDEPLVLTCRVEGQEYSYTFSRATATMAPAKVQIGKGLAGVYWQIELSNTAGADAEIDALELLVAPSDRRRV